MNTVAVLDQAETLIASRRRDRNRIATWLVRSVFEDVVRAHLIARGMDPGRGSMRSSLTCLEATAPNLAEQAEFAWSRLSNACHQHAFELAPTASEVQALIGLVRALQGPPAQDVVAQN